jgi:hypothetical protein
MSKSGKSSSADEPSSPEDHDEDEKERLPAIKDEDEDDDIEFDDDDMSKSQDNRDSSHTPGSYLDQSASPSTEASSTVPPTARPPMSRKGSAQATKTSTASKSSSSMARDLQFYLNYFRNHMSVHHYNLKRDTHSFLKGDFLSWALKFEPLKYAVAGYAAFFHTLAQPDGRVSSFLQFYNESVSRLRISITKNKKQGLATFLTILQLASIEVSKAWLYDQRYAYLWLRKCSATGSISWATRKLHSKCSPACTLHKASPNPIFYVKYFCGTSDSTCSWASNLAVNQSLVGSGTKQRTSATLRRCAIIQRI